MKVRLKLLSAAVTVLCSQLLNAQQTAEPPMRVPKVVPVPPLRSSAPLKEPASPAARNVEDKPDHLTLHLPAGWNVSRKDGDIATFSLDARMAPRSSRLHLAASLAFNPYPQSTFSGATFYISSAAGISAKQCAAETTTKPFEPLPPATIDTQTFARGKDEHGQICTEGRDVAYTAMRSHACLRFDLVINSFCGGDVSSAQDLSQNELQAIFTRLITILNSVHFLP